MADSSQNERAIHKNLRRAFVDGHQRDILVMMSTAHPDIMNNLQAVQAALRAVRRGDVHALKSVRSEGKTHWGELLSPEAWWDAATGRHASARMLGVLHDARCLRKLTSHSLQVGIKRLTQNGKNEALAYALDQRAWTAWIDQDAWFSLLKLAANTVAPGGAACIAALAEFRPHGAANPSKRRAQLTDLLGRVLVQEGPAASAGALLDLGAEPSASVSLGEHAIPFVHALLRQARFTSGHPPTWQLLERFLSAGATLDAKDSTGLSGWTLGSDLLAQSGISGNPQAERVLTSWAQLQHHHLEEAIFPCGVGERPHRARM